MYAGYDASFPVMIAPMAMHGMAHPGKEIATARAAATQRVPMVSNLAVAHMRAAQVAASVPRATPSADAALVPWVTRNANAALEPWVKSDADAARGCLAYLQPPLGRRAPQLPGRRGY